MATEPIYEELVGVCVDANGGAVGMPQLCPEWMPNQIFWLVITLIVIYLVLTRVALPRIAGILADRAGTITNDLAAAEDLKAKAVEAEKAYDMALADARAEAQRIAADTRAEIQADLDEAIAKADADIADKAAESEKAIADIRAGALESVRDVAKDTAATIIATFGGKPDQSAIDAAVAERVKG
ncbi:F0F1 ATP synthase subunit B' [Marinibacterium sp. SX1]|uniref:F0F1 ATP synthase subunit B' n=1 Tax=Marinibacterium sp. SX1 TaxID=3388424 RepID=UPI003D1669A7